MRLLRALEKVEARRAAGRRPAARAWCVVWSEAETLVGRLPVAGESVACDLFVVGDASDRASLYVRSAERFTLDPLDLGIVYDASGAEIGRIASVEDHWGTIRFADGSLYNVPGTCGAGNEKRIGNERVSRAR
jgi:hypothetical protein